MHRMATEPDYRSKPVDINFESCIIRTIEPESVEEYTEKMGQ